MIKKGHSATNKPYIDFNTGNDPIHKEGRVHWNPTDYTLNVDTGLGPELQVGQEIYVLVGNQTGGTLTNGTIVHPVGGATSGRPNVEPANNTDHTGVDRAVWVLTMNIDDGEIGFATRFGNVRGVDTSAFSAGDNLYVSDVDGVPTNVKPSLPDYVIQIGGVAVAAEDGTIFVSVQGVPFDTTHNFFNGTFRESFDFRTLVEDQGGGDKIYGTLEPSNGHPDMTMIFSDGFTLLDTNPIIDIELTAGTDARPQSNYIYIPKSTKVLTVSTSGFPNNIEHIRVSQVALQSIATTATQGALRNQNWDDHIASTDTEQGHLSHIGAKLRQFEAQWESGVELSVAGAPASNDVTIATTAGQVYQLHPQSFPAFDTSGTDDFHVVNQHTDNGGPYTTFSDLTDIVDDASSDSLLNTSFSLVVWGINNKGGEPAHLMLNLPTSTYNKNFPQTAVDDADAASVFTIPKQFAGVGFLIARLTFVNSGGTWTLYNNQDLRGSIPNITAGSSTGGAGVTTWLALSDTPSAYTDQALKIPQVAAGEAGLEFTSTPTLTGTNFTGLIASTVNIVDAGGLITATEVEAALQENRTAINLNTAKTIDDTAYDATSWDANTDAATKNAIRDKVETMDTAIGLNTAKDTNVTTNLSLGAVDATTMVVASSDGTDATLIEADTDDAGLLGADKWDEIVANTTHTTKNTTKTFALTVLDPTATQALTNEVFIAWTNAAITITKIQVELDTATAVTADLKWADDFVALTNAALIDVIDTAATGKFTATSGFDDATIASGKGIYLSFYGAPSATPKQYHLQISYTID